MENENNISENSGYISLNESSNTTTTGGDFALGNSYTTTGTFNLFPPKKHLIDTKFIENEEGNFIEVTYKVTYACQIWVGYQPPLATCIKERYGVKDGILQLIKTIKGKYTPEHTVPESYEWEE
jgi:hypothetical protein